MSGLDKSQQYTTCESARQHFTNYKAGQWGGSWSRSPKRPILAFLRVNLQSEEVKDGLVVGLQVQMTKMK